MLLDGFIIYELLVRIIDVPDEATENKVPIILEFLQVPVLWVIELNLTQVVDSVNPFCSDVCLVIVQNHPQQLAPPDGPVVPQGHYRSVV